MILYIHIHFICILNIYNKSKIHKRQALPGFVTDLTKEKAVVILKRQGNVKRTDLV